MFIVRSLFLLLLLFSSSSYAEEKLNYVINIVGVEFGDATMYTAKGKLYGEMSTNEKWGGVYKVDNKMASKTRKNGIPHKSEIEYNTTKVNSNYQFNFSRNKVKIVRTSKEKKKVFTKKRKTRVYDFLSMMQLVRKKAKEMKPLSYSVITGRKIYDINFVPIGKESLTTLLGVKETLSYEVIVTRPGGFKQKMKVWFEDDSLSTPIRLDGRTKLGSFEIMLTHKSLK